MGGGAPVARDEEGNVIHFPSRITTWLVYCVSIAGASGLLFGFDNGLTGGVSNMAPFQDKLFPDVSQLRMQYETSGSTGRPYCQFNSPKLELYTSCAYLTGLVGAPIASVCTQQRGRKLSLIIGGGLYLIGAVLQCSCQEIGQLLVGRLILGLGVGFVNQVAPLYLNEVAPAEIRGTINILYQFATTLGIFLAQLINYGTEKREFGWRISLGVQGFPGLFILITSFFVLETPNSLIERGNIDRGRKELKRLRGVDDVDAELQLIITASDEAKKVKNPWRSLFTKRNSPQATIAWAIPFFQQFTGINIIMFYAPQIFTTLGSDQRTSLKKGIYMGLTNFVSTIVAMAVVDRIGRRLLFIEGGIQMVASYAIFTGIIGSKFKAKGSVNMPNQQALLAFICLFVAGYAWSWGPLTFLVPPEVFTLETRPAGQAIVVGSEFLFSFIIAQAFLSMLCSMEYGVFIFFLCWCIIMTIFIWMLVPETKGIPLEEVHLKFRKHWFWGPIVGSKEEQKQLKQEAKERKMENGKGGKKGILKNKKGTQPNANNGDANGNTDGLQNPQSDNQVSGDQAENNNGNNIEGNAKV